MINTDRIFDILNFSISKDFAIADTGVVVKAGNNQIIREDKMYILKKSGVVYGKFEVSKGNKLFRALYRDM